MDYEYHPLYSARAHSSDKRTWPALAGKRPTHKPGLSGRNFLKHWGLVVWMLALNPSSSAQTRASSSKPRVVHTYRTRATNWYF